MRLIKGFILTIIGLFIIFTLLSLLIPSTVTVTRGVEINSTQQKIFDQVADLHNWKNWHPVFKTDSLAANYSAGSGLNSFCEWENRGKKNKLLITTAGENRVVIELSRPGENAVINTISILPLPDSSRVQVEWRAVTKLKWYPWEKFYGLFIEKMSGEGYDAALNSLKSYVEVH